MFTLLKNGDRIFESQDMPVALAEFDRRMAEIDEGCLELFDANGTCIRALRCGTGSATAESRG